MGACYSRREGERYAKDGCVKGAAAAVGTWQVQLEHGWADYDTATQGVLSRAREARKATVDIRVNGLSYTVHLPPGSGDGGMGGGGGGNIGGAPRQVNLQTSKVRPVRLLRGPSLPPAIQALLDRKQRVGGVHCSRDQQGAVVDFRITAAGVPAADISAFRPLISKALTYFDVSGNADISGDIGALAAAKGLKRAWLQGTSLAGDVATFAPMRCLEVLHLTGLQRVTGDIAAFGGPNPGVLTSLYLSGTGVSGDVAALCDCDALQHLQLGGCAGVGGEFPQDLAEKADLEVDLAGTAVVPVVSFAVSQYPLTLITSRDLLGLDRLLTHEDAKTRNLTCVVEQQINRFQSWLMKGSFTDILQRHEVAFVSHRWLSADHPDLADNTKLRHVQRIARAHPEVKAWWIDVISAPQEDPVAQMRAIRSLPHYVKCCGAFFVPVDNASKLERYHLSSWLASGWCRTERMAASAPYETYIDHEDIILSVHSGNIADLSDPGTPSPNDPTGAGTGTGLDDSALNDLSPPPLELRRSRSGSGRVVVADLRTVPVVVHASSSSPSSASSSSSADLMVEEPLDAVGFLDPLDGSFFDDGDPHKAPEKKDRNRIRIVRDRLAASYRMEGQTGSPHRI